MRIGALVFLASLGLQVSEISMLAAVSPHEVHTISSLDMRGENDAVLVTLSQTTDTPVVSPPDPDPAGELARIAALTTLVNRQETRSAGNLARVSSVEVVNRTLRPEFVVDARMERTVAAGAAAEAAALEAERSASLAAEAQAEAAAAVAAALAADQANDEAEAQATEVAMIATREAETAAMAATQEAEVAALAATQEAQVAAITATQEAAASAATSAIRAADTAAAEAKATAEAQAAAAEAKVAAAAESSRQFSQRVTMLLLSLALLVGSALGFRFWRNRKEPFVLKAIPASVTAQAHA